MLLNERLRILEIKEIVGTSQNWVQILGSSSQSLSKNKGESFLVQLTIAWILYFVLNILAMIAVFLFENLWWNEKPTTAFWLYYDKFVLQF